MSQPGHPAYPPPYRPQAGSRRRWPAAVVAGIGGAVIAATITALITTKNAHPAATKPPTAVTVTATPAAPTPPPPLPTAQADRQTCNAWLAAGKHVDAASAALKALPKAVTVIDPAIRDNPQWSEAVRTSAVEHDRAGDTLTAGIAAGTTTVLERAATTAAAALHALAVSDATADPANGNSFTPGKKQPER